MIRNWLGAEPEAGCRAFTQAEAPIADTNVLLRAMEYAATFGSACGCGRRIWRWRMVAWHTTARGFAPRLASHTRAAETVALATICSWRRNGRRVHLNAPVHA